VWITQHVVVEQMVAQVVVVEQPDVVVEQQHMVALG